MIRPTLIVLLFFLGVSSRGNPPEVSSSPFELDREKKEVTHHDAKGNVIWSVKFDEAIGAVRLPHCLWDERRVYFTHKDGVTALDRKTGKTLWHAQGPQDGLLLSDGLLLGTGPLPDKDDTFSHWLFACEVAKGA